MGVAREIAKAFVAAKLLDGVLEIKVVDGVVTDTRPEGCTASEVVQKAIAIPSIRRMWEMSG